ncbi:hypothetical protein FTO68_00025 [Methanocalculus taiwanensis]|uniref:Uncharacterized protein n=1 Tax=Methanocalculus taiwanensis TaxID=106207 RepID=A0ABD4TIT5_9EURY|nr:hypothetical protein [Methanocalculus taiwanensis]MCQ1537397.1 hypothetical protein [Methanocalculus taiwanensis]
MDEQIKKYGVMVLVILIAIAVGVISYQAGVQSGYSAGFEDGELAGASVLNAPGTTTYNKCLDYCYVNYADRQTILDSCLQNCQITYK